MKLARLLLVFALLTSQTAFAKTFSDVDSDNPYFIPASYLSEEGIIGGYPDGSFQPFKDINRAELLKILMEGSSLELTTPTTNCFKDVGYLEWYAPYVCTAKEMKFVSGYDDGRFRPEQTINKVEAIKMVGGIYGWDLTENQEAELFSDTEPDAWYAPYLKYAKTLNFLPETGGTYNPANSITRGSISQTLYRLLATKELEEESFSPSITEQIKKTLQLEEPMEEPPIGEEEQTYSFSGLITDATTGFAVETASVTLYDLEDNYITSTTSNTEGEFSLETTSIPTNGHLTFSKNSYFTLTTTKLKTDKDYHVSLSTNFTNITPEGLRIVLSWGNYDTDFDAHLIKPNGEEIFFMTRLDSNIKTILDLDATTANGTETITIRELDIPETEEGKAEIENPIYEFFVHNYSNTETFASAQTHVEVYDKNGLAKSYYPSSNEGEIWRIFTLSTTGEIHDINTIGTCDIVEKETSVCS